MLKRLLAVLKNRPVTAEPSKQTAAQNATDTGQTATPRRHHRMDPTSQFGEYTLTYPYRYSTFSPWFTPPFSDIFWRVQPYTLNTEDRCYLLHAFCSQAFKLPGDVAECGVYKGGTALLLAELISQECPGRTLHLFDTFAGMPPAADEDPSQFTSNSLSDTSLDQIKTLLAPHNDVVFHQGLIPETFTHVADKSFAFVHVDVDLYVSTRDCCDFFYDRLARGGFLICDDYGFPNYRNSAKKALDEFFADKPETVIVLPTGQALVVKL